MKGQISFNMMMYIPRYIFLMVVVLILVVVTNSYLNVDIQTEQAEAQVILERIIYSPNLLIYVDGVTNRPYPGIIDYDKWTNLNDDKFSKAICYKSDFCNNNNLIALRISIEDKSVYLNKNSFDSWYPLSLLSVKESSLFYSKKEFFVLEKKNGDYIEKKLVAEVIIPTE